MEENFSGCFFSEHSVCIIVVIILTFGRYKYKLISDAKRVHIYFIITGIISQRLNVYTQPNLTPVFGVTPSAFGNGVSFL